MTVLDNDADAWAAFPQHRDWFDKLRLSLRFGYACGPTGVPPQRSDHYVVRPIYNLLGMGAGARIEFINAGDDSVVPPGFFWCEIFRGKHLSITYRWEGGWQPISCWEGILEEGSLSRFWAWYRSTETIPAPSLLDELADVEVINVEYIGGRPIEVHLRRSPDPDYGNVMFPIWEDQDRPDDMVESFDNAAGHLDVARLGFRIL